MTRDLEAGWRELPWLSTWHRGDQVSLDLAAADGTARFWYELGPDGVRAVDPAGTMVAVMDLGTAPEAAQLADADTRRGDEPAAS